MHGCFYFLRGKKGSHEVSNSLTKGLFYTSAGLSWPVCMLDGILVGHQARLSLGGLAVSCTVA